MADILIRMNMPKTCSQCPIFNFDYGICNDLSTHNRDFETSRIDGCPLVELPEHGDLIDRDWLKGMAYSKVEDFGGAFLDTVDIAIAPVVIPSNKENKNAN